MIISYHKFSQSRCTERSTFRTSFLSLKIWILKGTPRENNEKGFLLNIFSNSTLKSPLHLPS